MSTIDANRANLYIESSKHLKDLYSIKKRANIIVEKFGNQEISSITELEIELWLNNLKHYRTGGELSKNSRKKYKTTLNKIFTLAKKDRAIEDNFIENIDVQGEGKDKNAINPFSDKEVHLLLEKSKEKQYGELLHYYLGLILHTGLSPSEAIALKVSDISFDEHTNVNVLSISRSITKNILGSTKNEYRERKIILMKQAMPYIALLVSLAKHKQTEWLFSDKNGLRLKDISSLRGTRECHDKNGKISHNNTRWYKLLYDLKMEYRPIKNLRHTFAISMLNAGYTIIEVADILGHNSIQMVIEHYAKGIRGKGMEIIENKRLY